jgi:hypothetical protein
MIKLPFLPDFQQLDEFAQRTSIHLGKALGPEVDA